MSYPGANDESDDGSGLAPYFAQNGGSSPDRIARQMALANALQKEGQIIPQGAYGGLHSAVANIAGAMLGNQASNQQAARYANVMKSLFGDGQQAPPPQPSQASQVASGQLDPEGNPLVSTQPPPAAAPPSAPGGPLSTALGPSRAKLYAALMQAEGPSAGMAQLPEMVKEAANRQQAQELYAQLTGQPTGAMAAPPQASAAMPAALAEPSPAATTASPPQSAPGLLPYQQRQLHLAAMSGNPAEVMKVAQSFNAPLDLGGNRYIPDATAPNGYRAILTPNAVTTIQPNQYAQYGIDPHSVPPGTIAQINPTTNKIEFAKGGDVKTQEAQRQAIEAASARATAMMNAQVDPQAIQGAVDYFKATGQLPPNARSPAMQTQVLKALENEGQGGGQVFAQGIDTRVGIHGRQGAATNLAKQQAGTQVNEDTVNGAMNILNGLLAKGAAGPTNITGVNDLSVWARQHTNDPDAANLVNGIGAISNEYARVMTGTTSGTPSSDSARNEAATRILHGYNAGTMQAVMGQMQQEMANRSQAQRGALEQVTHGAYTGVTPTIQYNNPNNQRLSPQDAAKLPSGTPFVGLDGVPRVKH